MRTTQRFLLLAITSIVVPGAFGAEIEITKLDAAADGDTVRIEIGLTSAFKPVVHSAPQMGLLVLDFQNVGIQAPTQRIAVNGAGVIDVHGAVHSAAPLDTWVVVRMDSDRSFGIENAGNSLVVNIRPAADSPTTGFKNSPAKPSSNRAPAFANRMPEITKQPVTASTAVASPEVEYLPASSRIDVQAVDVPAMVRRRFRVKFVSGNTVYIDGGSNAGLRTGMDLDIRSAEVDSDQAESDEAPIGAARIVGVATMSAILEVGTSSEALKVGDWADLLPRDADTARKNVIAGSGNTVRTAARPVDDDADVVAAKQSFRPSQTIEEPPGTRTAGRIGLDYSGISSTGSTPGQSVQMGMSFQSDMRHILGTHWNLEGYWRGRINNHSQFQEATIEDSLNKTYTMELYYDNPQSKWVAGMGRLYLPWAVSLDTVDGGYLGHRFRAGNTTGVFAGSTPDLSSWHYRPDQRIGGIFTNFEGGDYDRFHYSSTTGAALTSVKWKLDRPFVFFENEVSYKGKVSAYHSLIYDSPQGVTTNGIRPGAGVSHSYFTLHYQPKPVVSFDLYHNFFRDVPTAVTSIVGTGLVDKLLFQGISAGTHVKPNRYFTLYTTLGASNKTGDAHPSLNEMFGATWNEILHTGMRADFHYSKFNSNFGDGHYEVLSLSRQLTNRMFWNVQLGKQDVVSTHTLDCFSNFIDDSMDINLGRHSYLQSGYTYVKGDTMNYRQWYMSWGYRFDQGKSNPQFVQTMLPRN